MVEVESEGKGDEDDARELDRRLDEINDEAREVEYDLKAVEAELDTSKSTLKATKEALERVKAESLRKEKELKAEDSKKRSLERQIGEREKLAENAALQNLFSNWTMFRRVFCASNLVSLGERTFFLPIGDGILPGLTIVGTLFC